MIFNDTFFCNTPIQLWQALLVGDTRGTVVCVDNAAARETVQGQYVLHNSIVCMRICTEIVDTVPAPAYAGIHNAFYQTGGSKTMDGPVWSRSKPPAVFNEPVCRILPYNETERSGNLS